MIDLQTDRLRFRQWEHSDHPAFATYFGDAINTQFLGGVINSESAYRLLTSYIGHQALHGYSYVAVEEKKLGCFSRFRWIVEFSRLARARAGILVATRFSREWLWSRSSCSGSGFCKKIKENFPHW